MLLVVTDDGGVASSSNDSFVGEAAGAIPEPSVRYEGGCLACGVRFESDTERRVRDLVASHVCAKAASAGPDRPHTASMMQPVEGALAEDSVRPSSRGSFATNPRQFATILAALRSWQNVLGQAPDHAEDGLRATAARAGTPLDRDEVGDLIELLELAYKDDSAKTVPAEFAPPP